MTLSRLFYAIYFWSMSSIMPYYAMHYEARGIPPIQLSILMAIPPLGTMLASPVWSALADKSQKHRRVLLIATTGMIIAGIGYVVSQSFWAILPFVVLFSVCVAPQMPIVDASVMLHLGNRKDEYGRQRLLGSAAVAISGPMVSALVKRFGLDASLYSYIASVVAMWLLLSQIPLRTQPQMGNFTKQLKVLLRDRRLVSFLAVVLFGMTGYSTIMHFLFVRMDELGASNTLMGLALTMGTVGEIPFLFLSNALVRKWGSRGVALASLSAITLFLFGIALAPSAEWVLLLQLFHGMCFSGMMVAGVAYMDKLAPKGLESTAQGLFSSIASGFALAIGAFVGGLIRARFGNQAMFLTAAVVVSITLAVFTLRPIQDTTGA